MDSEWLIEDVTTRIRSGFAHPGDAIVLLGATREELSGSIWADAVHNGHLGGLPPQVDMAAELGLARVLQAAARQELLTSAHDLSEGGLGVALVESALRHACGFAVTLPQDDATVALFSESAARAIVSLPGHHLRRLEELCAEQGVEISRLGEVTGDDVAEFVGVFSLGLDEIREAWQRPLPEAMAG